jgi:hypothetical protein
MNTDIGLQTECPVQTSASSFLAEPDQERLWKPETAENLLLRKQTATVTEESSRAVVIEAAMGPEADAATTMAIGEHERDADHISPDELKICLCEAPGPCPTQGDSEMQKIRSSGAFKSMPQSAEYRNGALLDGSTHREEMRWQTKKEGPIVPQRVSRGAQRLPVITLLL